MGAQTVANARREKEMSIPYKVRPYKNPLDEKAKEKFYPAPLYHGELGFDAMCSEISEKTALTPSEVRGVIDALLTSVPKYMLLGYKVRLEGLGIFRFTFSGNGKETSDEVSSTDIRAEKIHFTPDVRLKAKMAKPEYVRA